ncbi:MAG: DUF4179 domain-containing protein [Bacillota bacterium]
MYLLNKHTFKKTIAVTAASAMLGLGILGTSHVLASPAAAASTSQSSSSLFSRSEEKGLQKAAEQGLTKKVNYSATHGGVTLKAVEYFYDGTRVNVLLQREGAKFPLPMTAEIPGIREGVVIGDVKEKGIYVGSDFLYNGKKLTNIGFNSVDFGPNDDSMFLEFNDAIRKANRPASPDKFNLTLKVGLSGVKEVFELTFPVVKTTGKSNNIVMRPAAKKSFGSFSYQVTRLEVTPFTNRLELNSNGKYKGAEVYYDLADDKGKLSKSLMPLPHAYYDSTYSQFSQIPASMTIKPYILTKNKDGALEMDDQGHPKKTYIKELEMKIQIKK